MNKIVQVAVGVIYQDEAFFLTKRLADAHQGDKWEFPGGKVEKDENVSETLFRELKEEVDIEILSATPLMVIEHDYGDKKVCLEVFVVDNFMGEPSAQEGQGQGWFTLSELKLLDFPAANTSIIEKLAARGY